MNKGVIIGIVFGIIVIGIIAFNSIDFESNNIPVEEIVSETQTTGEEIVSETQTTGRNLSVELSESVGLRSSP